MTEEEWQHAADVGGMLGWVDRPNSRKLRLAVVAIARLVLTRFPDPDVAAAFDALEEFADTGDRKDRERGGLFFQWDWVRRPACGALMWAHRGAGGGDGTCRAAEVTRAVIDELGRAGVPRETVGQDVAARVREVFGNPFRPVVFDPSWGTSTAVALARGMYESRDFGAMPILADALQDAGCENPDILGHCRGDGLHVRGCWVVDLVLGKS